MKGRIRPWGADLPAALAALSGDLALILVGQGPVAYHAPAPAAEQAARVTAAHQRSGDNLTFHLFSKDVEYRWDAGAGVELAVAADGDCDLVERTVLLARELKRSEAGQALLARAPNASVQVREFHRGGAPVDLKLEALV